MMQMQLLYNIILYHIYRIRVFNVTINNISVILWQSFSMVKEARVSRRNDRPAASHRVLSSTTRNEQDSNSQL